MVARRDRVDNDDLHGGGGATMVLTVVNPEPTCASGTVPPVACMSFVQAPPTGGALLGKCLTYIWCMVLSARSIINAPTLITLELVSGSYSVCSLCGITIKLVCVYHPLTGLTFLTMLECDIPASLCVCGM